MPLNFPTNPTTNDTYTYNSATWVWTGSRWEVQTSGSGGSGVAAVYDIASTSTGYFDLPSGNTAQRPGSPDTGMIRYNSTTGFAEVYTSVGWGSFGAQPPSISTVTPATYNGEAGTTFTINGANFTADAVVKFVDVNNIEYTAGAVVFVNQSQLTATTPQDFTVAQEPLDVKVVQTSGQVTKVDCIDCGGTPTWSTAAGTIATLYDIQATGNFANVIATDPDLGASITYSIVSGALPGNVVLTNSGQITGTANLISTSTTYTFTVAATDNAGNQSTRQFSIVLNPGTEPGNGAGYVTALSISTNALQITDTSYTTYLLNDKNAGSAPASWLDYNAVCNSSNFSMHTGHQAGWWPTYGCVRITTGTPRVINQYRWKKHSNACGNVDFYGSNKDITSGNYTDLSLYTYLGRGYFGGSGSEGDCTVKTASFNANGYGYRFYLMIVQDNAGSLSYPSVGSRGGWAMMTATWDKV